MNTLKSYLLKCFLISASVLILSIPVLWLQIYYPQVIYLVEGFLDRYSTESVVLHFILISGFYMVWPKMILWVARKEAWNPEKRRFWLSQRLRVVVWFGIFEVMVNIIS
jgi:hypothetical protein